MQNSIISELINQPLVLAVTHDHSKVWLLKDGSSDVKLRVNRPGDGATYTWFEESHRGHSSEVNMP